MHEGFNPAQTLVEKGVAVFVLKNRLQSSGYKFDVEGLADMQRAIRIVRSRAAAWEVDPGKIGAGGFSAGGELAELVALKNDAGNPDAPGPIDKASSRLDFQVMIYPGKTHLIQPVADSPPAFLAAGYEDRPDISTGLAEAYLRFKKAGVQAELHIYCADRSRIRPAARARWTIPSGMARSARLVPASTRHDQVSHEFSCEHPARRCCSEAGCPGPNPLAGNATCAGTLPLPRRLVAGL